MSVNDRLWAAVEKYREMVVDQVEAIEDPHEPGTYAIRVDYGSGWFDYYLVEGYAGQSLDWIVDALEEADFTEWPPISREAA